MAYKLLYTKRALQDIGQLDSLARKRLAKKLLILQEDPIGTSKKLVMSDLGTYRYRIGDYRVIFDLAKKEIVVLRVGHRREIYR